MNSLFLTDGYKLGHHQQYPQGTTKVYTNLTARRNSYGAKTCDGVVFFGLQLALGYLEKHYKENFFQKDKDEVCQEAKVAFSNFINNDYDVTHFEELHDLGYLPIDVKALPEGTLVPFGVPMFTIENTLPKFYWITNYLETILSNLLWHGITTATIAREYKKILTKYALETDKDNIGFVNFQAHDFSMRGLSGDYAGLAVGLGHATSFNGSDNLSTIQGAKEYYRHDIKDFLIGGVPATEHSVMCAGGMETELETYRRLLNIYPTGILSVVSDTWDLWKVIAEHLPALKDEIMSRDGKLVIRPDCYSEDTLFLTNYGWKTIDAIKQGALIAQVEEDESYTFVQPSKIVDEYYEGEMYKYTDFHGKMDLLVTPNHRMIYKQFDNWKVDFAENCKPNNYTKQFIRSAKAPNKRRKLSFIERLNIAFQADGSYVTGVSSSIRFSFSKIRKIQRLENLLNENNIEYSSYNLDDGKIEFSIKIDKSQVSKDFNWVNINDLCSNWCQEFIEELSHWDSSIRNEGRIKFDTTNSAVISIVELIALSSGYGCLISEYEDERSELFSKVYTANILLNNKLGGQSIQVEKTHYNGNIVCVTVPTGRIVVKRNRCTMVCGNSGNPVDIICGNKVDTFGNWKNIQDDEYKNVSEKTFRNICESKGVIELLWDIFGGTVNEQGYKVLDPHIGAIYGDSITLERCEEICSRLKAKGFASTNVVFGVGSYTYQCQTRDVFGMALKSTYVEINGKAMDIYKNPITDDGTKTSAKGLLSVIEQDGKLVLVQGTNKHPDNLLKSVFNPALKVVNTFTEIRNRIAV